jgi:hypothetical protein
MPVKIGHIQVIANIATDGPGKQSPGSGDAPGGKPGVLPEEVRQRIIEDTVQQVMDILQRQNER